MATTRTEVVGADRLASGLRGMARGLPGDLAPELTEGARRLQSGAADRAPRRTGALASSITAATSGGTIGVDSRRPYARLQENRRHYAARALEAERSNVLSAMDGGLRRLLARIKGA